MHKKYRDAKRLRGECLNDKNKARKGKAYCAHCAGLSDMRGARFRMWHLLPYLEPFTRSMLARPLTTPIKSQEKKPKLMRTSRY
jgi:hypothetical protein